MPEAAACVQEAMYQPLGLECGHKFCADCAFSAVGKGNALGTVRAILDHVDPEAACPECRTKGVYVFAMELKETEKLIKQRYSPCPSVLSLTSRPTWLEVLRSTQGISCFAFRPSHAATGLNLTCQAERNR